MQNSFTAMMQTPRLAITHFITRLIALLLVPCCTACQSPDKGFEFALLGDNPYSKETYVRYEQMIEHVNAHDELRWVVHLGDLKGGSTSCADASLRERFDLNQRFEPAFIFTPGDNDWYDCSRKGAGSYNEEERLTFLRKLFYPNPEQSTGGRPISLEPQSNSTDYPEFVENVLWEQNRVLFATIHLVGLTRTAKDLEALRRRLAAAAAWIDHAFEQADARNAKALFLVTQVDPWIIWGNPDLLNAACPDCMKSRQGLEWLYTQLAERTLKFGKPVVLAVGDTHIFRIDKPLYDKNNKLIKNFTRVEAFGFPDVHWVRVRVEPETTWVFSFHQQIVE